MCFITVITFIFPFKNIYDDTILMIPTSFIFILGSDFYIFYNFSKRNLTNDKIS